MDEGRRGRNERLPRSSLSGVGFAASIIGFSPNISPVWTLAIDPGPTYPLGVFVYDSSEPFAVTAQLPALSCKRFMTAWDVVIKPLLIFCNARALSELSAVTTYSMSPVLQLRALKGQTR